MGHVGEAELKDPIGWKWKEEYGSSASPAAAGPDASRSTLHRRHRPSPAAPQHAAGLPASHPKPVRQNVKL